LCDGAQTAIFGDFCVLHFQQAACSTFQTCILNSHYKATPCVEVWQTSNLRRLRLGEEKREEEEEEEEERKKPQDENTVVCPIP